MPSETDCLNDALGQCGTTPVTAINDGTPNANWCQTFYPTLRDHSQTSHAWKFNRVRALLAQDNATPPFEFTFQYSLPSDPWCLQIIEYNGTELDLSTLDFLGNFTILPGRYKIEGRKLLTNDGSVAIMYLARVTNPDLWHPMFYQYMTTALASKLCLAINKDEKKARALFEMSRTMWDDAVAVDSQQGSIEPFQVDDLIWGR